MFHCPSPPAREHGLNNVTVQCLLILKVNTARQTVNRKLFLGEYERTVYSRFEVRGSKFEPRD
ncbi:MAG: hypothetical protein FWC60_11605 [Firmicutes bacterium]|nr:hypothetical protein [Bacillota bacterium]